MPKRIAVIHKDKCNPQGCGGYLCIKVCPVNKGGEECIFVADDKKAGISEPLCIGCLICVHKCPYGAISIINLPEEWNKNPLHRYGENKFSIYSMPTPFMSKVTGVLGRNGIGKSTAIKILAQVFKPNLGEWDKEASTQDILKYFRGTEAQIFFQLLQEGKINVAYKPQNVELIPKNAKGKVEELLRNVKKAGAKNTDSKNKIALFDKVIEQLELGKILNTDIGKISGGELQRVAIAAALLKDANLYIFDEPTSFLDIKQRIKVSRIIRDLVSNEDKKKNDNTAVLLVEHDLLILDYMTEMVYLMYGEESVYGVVSLPKATRTGINTYLSGYLKDENIRFREKTIKFEAKPPVALKRNENLISWKGISKQLGNFKLKAPEGEIYRNQVIGILGENGIGKTSFVKILAGVLESDSGEVDRKLQVSYKPQYLEASDDIVIDVVRGHEKYTNNIIKPLQIDKLMQKKVSELSGGELQRVAIARCLIQDADLYLLDEPSAYLDVEQRLLISKIIKDFMEHKGTAALIVDHDIIFLDYVSEKLIVVDGEPAVSGTVYGPFTMEEGMNRFLRSLDVTMRRDDETNRPRINKQGSQKDKEQKASGKLYYG